MKSLFLLTVSLPLMLQMSNALNYYAENRITKVWDNIKVYDDSDALLTSVNLTSFPYIKGYETNITEPGVLCWSPNMTHYEDTCLNVEPDTYWIMINPFEDAASNEIIDDVKNVTADVSGVVGLIFQTE